MLGRITYYHEDLVYKTQYHSPKVFPIKKLTHKQLINIRNQILPRKMNLKKNIGHVLRECIVSDDTRTGSDCSELENFTIAQHETRINKYNNCAFPNIAHKFVNIKDIIPLPDFLETN